MILGCLVAFLLAAEGLVRPSALKVGDTIGFISPASTPTGSSSAFRTHVIQSMDAISYKVVFGPHSFDVYGYLAGTDPERASDVETMFTSPHVKAIIANRGGWGCNRIIDMIDYEDVIKNPKIIMGYSDLTGLLNAIFMKTGMVTFHGPMGLDDWAGWNSNYTVDVFQNKKLVTFGVEDGFPITTIKSGKARGRLVGGNLSVFVAMIGSIYIPYPPMLDDFVLFLEDVEEAPYSIDRMLTQLHLAGFLDSVKAIVFGRCTSCTASSGFTFAQVLQQKFGDLQIPIFSGAMFGHIASQYVLPIGALVEIDADKGTIKMLEAVVA